MRERDARRRPERLGDARRRDHPAEWQVAARDALREHDEIGLEPEALDPEPRAEAAEPADDAVGDRQHAVPATDLRHRVQVSGRRWQDTARADHGLEDEGGDVLGPEPLDLRLERLGVIPRDLRRLEHEWPELVLVGQAQDARADPVRPVVPARPADQMSPPRLAADAVNEPRQLRRRLDRVTTPARQEHLRARLRRQTGKPIGQLERRAVGDVAEEVEALQRPQLGRDRLRDLLPSVTDVRVPEARRAVEVASPLLVPHEDALASGEHELGSVHRRHVGERVPERRHRPPIATESSRAAATRTTAASSSRPSNRNPGPEALTAATIAPDGPRTGAAAATSPGSKAFLTIA